MNPLRTDCILRNTMSQRRDKRCRKGGGERTQGFQIVFVFDHYEAVHFPRRLQHSRAATQSTLLILCGPRGLSLCCGTVTQWGSNLVEPGAYASGGTPMYE